MVLVSGTSLIPNKGNQTQKFHQLLPLKKVKHSAAESL